MNASRTIDSTGCAGDDSSVRICTGSRLHFGLLDTVRPFGGVGVMLNAPSTEVVVSTADRFHCPEEFQARIGPIAERIRQLSGEAELPRCRVEVLRTAPPHCGLGSGTQLALAVTESLCFHQAMEVEQFTIANTLASRGRRSVVGTHGYWQGGLIYESGESGSGEKAVGEDINVVQAGVHLPDDWRVAVLKPLDHEFAVSGERERQKFARLLPASAQVGHELRRLVTEEIIPAAKQSDFAAFADSTRIYNELSGQLFTKVQGGPYNGPAVTRVIEWLSDRGVPGHGQSSWGPGVFAWFESTKVAERCLASLPGNIELVTLASARNEPRSVLVSGSP
ncbi:beta-ribofuranosylaminobenzene 5'-phosphate synthase [Rhodopirellula sp.]|nr:beta-ribofuranosylaminobenzene 5'-phosphate synthase [Rhodopirellula sp.]MDC0307294.1 beta-ribofuranosylaminobenzene 5'-phosphate synthase [bacterium]MDC0326138.1 beta-ribofuranosylaminobenzene 5'-phosphate synthase [bacterium]